MNLVIRKHLNNWVVSYKKKQPYSIIPPIFWEFQTFEEARRFAWSYGA